MKVWLLTKLPIRHPRPHALQNQSECLLAFVNVCWLWVPMWQKVYLPFFGVEVVPLKAKRKVQLIQYDN